MWCSILEGVEVLKLGCLWRVGNGTHMKVWQDPWIPSSPKFKAGMPNPYAHSVERVSELLLDGLKRWNEALIHDCFDLATAEAIMQILLGQTLNLDSISWAHDKKGLVHGEKGIQSGLE